MTAQGARPAYPLAVPTVAVSRTLTQPRRLPAVCVKTGVPTQESVRLTGTAAPAWTGAMIFFGLFAWLVASWMTSRRYEIVVPFRNQVFQRYCKWRRAGRVLIVLGPLMAVVAAVSARDNAFLLLGVSVLGLAFTAANEWANAVGVRLSRDGGLLLTRVHPNFERALLERAGTGTAKR